MRSSPATLELADAWLTGWTRLRGIRVDEVDGWPRLDVRSASRDTEVVCVDLAPADLARALGLVAGDPRGQLTAVGDHVDALDGVPLPHDVRLDRGDETLMATALTDPGRSATPEGLTAHWQLDDHVSTVSLETGASVAAHGSVGVIGPVATFDAIETLPAHRRQGLGTVVMAELTRHARTVGATRGVLAASADGRALYEALGWRVVAPMRSYVGDP